MMFRSRSLLPALASLVVVGPSLSLGAATHQPDLMPTRSPVGPVLNQQNRHAATSSSLEPFLIDDFVNPNTRFDARQRTASRSNPRLKRPDLKARKPEAVSWVRTYDGWNNNLRIASMGSTGSQQNRNKSAAYYADGIGEMLQGPNAREVSNALAQQTNPLGNSRGLSSMFWQWGQFIDHDITLVGEGHEFVPIVVSSTSDPVFSPGAIIPFSRSDYEAGTESDGARQYANQITHWMDASMVYGSDEERSYALRSFEGGRLLSGDDGFMGRNTVGLGNASDGRSADEDLFLAGDIRANESAGLTAMHEVFFRYHNDWADKLSERHASWDDERVYQTARSIVAAQVQSITYNQWLTAMLGEDAVRRYDGYRADVDATQSVVFSTTAFRLGHTMVTSQLERYNADGSEYSGGHLSLVDAFFNPDVIASEDGLASIMRGLAWQEANEVDTQAVEALRSFLFGDPSVGGLDLIALNIQRGRDHGVGDYNSVREDYGLGRVESFDEITSDGDLAAALETVYGSIDEIDPWIGMMAEDHLDDAVVGETVARIIIDQFTRMRDGDRFWYENDPTMARYLAEIESMSLADVIAQVTDAELSGDVFFANSFSDAFEVTTPSLVPEPMSLALLGFGGLLITGRRRRG